MNTRLTLTALIATLTTSVASATVLFQWDFNDNASTALTATSQSVSPNTSFATTITGVTTDGSGNLNVNNAAGSNNSFLGSSGVATALNFTTGTYALDVKISSWQFTTNLAGSLGGTGAGLYIGFLDDNASTVTTDLNITSNGSNMLVQSRAQTVNSNTSASNFALSGSNLLIRLLVDADANTSSLLYSTNNGVSFTSITSAVSYGAREANYFRFRSSANWSGATDGLLIDSITITSIPEPSSAAMLAGGLVLGMVAMRRRR